MIRRTGVLAVMFAAAFVATALPAQAAAVPQIRRWPAAALPAADPFIATSARSNRTNQDDIELTDIRTGRSVVFPTSVMVSGLVASPDGRLVAFDYSTFVGQKEQFGLGELATASGAVKLLTSPTSATFDYPTFSQDSSTIAFAFEDKIETIPAAGGPTTELFDPPQPRNDAELTGLAWGPQDSIVYSLNVNGANAERTDCDLASESASDGYSDPSTCLITEGQLADAVAGATGGLEPTMGQLSEVLPGVPAPTLGTFGDAHHVAFAISFRGPHYDYGLIAATFDLTGSQAPFLLPATDERSAVNPVPTDLAPALDPTGDEVVFQGPGGLEAVDTNTGLHTADIATTAGGAVAMYFAGVAPAGSAFETLPAARRVLDTRSGRGAPRGPVAAGRPIDVAVTGNGIPASATAVALTLTGTAASTSTYVEVTPTPSADEPLPFTSTLNLAPGQTVANSATVAVGAGGRIRVAVGVGSAHVLADITGYYVPADRDDPSSQLSYVPFPAPIREVDTRSGLGVTGGPLGPGAHADWKPGASVALGGPGDADLSAVVLQIGAVAHTAQTYVGVYPVASDGTAFTGQTSALTLAAGTVRSSLITVPVTSSGSIRFYNAAGRTDVFATIVGYYDRGLAGSLFVPIRPTRIYDTRNGTNEVDGPHPLAGGTATTAVGGEIVTTGYGQAQLYGRVLQLNVTVAGATKPTYVSLYPANPLRDDGAINPEPTTASTVNVMNSDPVAAADIVEGGENGLGIYNAVGNADVILDVAGYFSAN